MSREHSDHREIAHAIQGLSMSEEDLGGIVSSLLQGRFGHLVSNDGLLEYRLYDPLLAVVQRVRFPNEPTPVCYADLIGLSILANALRRHAEADVADAEQLERFHNELLQQMRAPVEAEGVS